MSTDEYPAEEYDWVTVDCRVCGKAMRMPVHKKMERSMSEKLMKMTACEDCYKRRSAKLDVMEGMEEAAKLLGKAPEKAESLRPWLRALIRKLCAAYADENDSPLDAFDEVYVDWLINEPGKWTEILRRISSAVKKITSPHVATQTTNRKE